MFLKKLRLHATELCLLLLIIAAVLVRFLLISLHWPPTDSDESTVDLMALHIITRGEHPIFFYGQGYMGTLQAYLGAISYHFFGISVFAVRLGLLPLFALYLVCMYSMTRLLFTKKFALVTVALLSLGSSTMVAIPIFANGGYSETLFFGSFIFLLIIYLALSSQLSAEERSPGQRIRRILVFGLLGLTTGLALWSDFLIIPCLLSAYVILGLFCRRDLRSWAGGCLLLFLFIGIVPIILYNLSPLPGSNSLQSILGITGYTRTIGISWFQKMGQVLLISMPLATGAYPLCGVTEPMSGVNSIAGFFPQGQAVPCALSHAAWTLGLLTLWSVAVVLAVLPIWKKRRSVKDWSPEERLQMIRLTARLMLLTSAALTFLFFASSVRAGTTPRTSARYLLCILFTTPVVLWTLWHGMETLQRTTIIALRRVRVLLIIRVAILLLIALVLVDGTLGIRNEIPQVQATYNQQETLISDLVQIRATRIYSDYWTCGRLIFQSNEQIICSNLDQNLKPGFNRYPLYHTIVKSTPYPAYVFALNSPYAHALVQASHTLNKGYRKHIFNGYLVYAVTTPHG